MIVPALETVSRYYRKNPIATPRQLVNALEKGSVGLFHCRNYPLGHYATSIKTYIQSVKAGDTQPYPIEYEVGFEPYFVLRTEIAPRYATLAFLSIKHWPSSYLP